MRRLRRAAARLAAEVAGFDDVLTAVRQRIAALQPHGERRLVHGDYFPGNVMIGDDLAVSGVIDFGTLTVMGDTAMDVVSAIIFIEVVPAGDPEDAAYLTARAVRTRGAGFVELMRAYRAYYALRLAPYAEADDARLYAWCARTLEAVGGA